MESQIQPYTLTEWFMIIYMWGKQVLFIPAFAFTHLSLLFYFPNKHKLSVAHQGRPAECSNHLRRRFCTLLFLSCAWTNRRPLKADFKPRCAQMPVTRTTNSSVKHFQKAAVGRTKIVFMSNSVLISLNEKKKCEQMIMQKLRKETLNTLF